MVEIELNSFPFDSMKVLNEESGKMEGDRKYDAKVFQDYFRKFLSNGVYYGEYKGYGENGMKPILDGGLNVKILKGAGIIEGADYELEEDTILTFERPAIGERIDRIVVKKDSSLSVRATSMYIKQGNGMEAAALERDNNIYEICIAEITVRSTTNLSETDIKDTRLDENLCGIVNSLISVSGEKLYQQFQEYIDTVVNNLVRKDQDIVIEGNIVAKSIKQIDGKTFSTNDFSNDYKTKLDNISDNANNYVHPSTHAATMISETTARRFVSDSEKNTWNAKQKAISKGTANPSRRK